MKKYQINYYSNSCIYAEFLKDQDWFIFLDSCNDISDFGRYDILTCDPYIKIVSNGKKVNVRKDGLTSSFIDNPFAIINKYYREDRTMYIYT